MSKKTIGLLSLALSLGSILYVFYNSLKNLDFEVFDLDEDSDQDD
jgi:hypothetical protein